MHAPHFLMIREVLKKILSSSPIFILSTLTTFFLISLIFPKILSPSPKKPLHFLIKKIASVTFLRTPYISLKIPPDRVSSLDGWWLKPESKSIPHPLLHHLSFSPGLHGSYSVGKKSLEIDVAFWVTEDKSRGVSFRAFWVTSETFITVWWEYVGKRGKKWCFLRELWREKLCWVNLFYLI